MDAPRFIRDSKAQTEIIGKTIIIMFFVLIFFFINVFFSSTNEVQLSDAEFRAVKAYKFIVNSPDLACYTAGTKYDACLDGTKLSQKRTEDYADILGFAEIKLAGSGTTLLYTNPKPGWKQKISYIFPVSIYSSGEFTAGNLIVVVFQ